MCPKVLDSVTCSVWSIVREQLCKQKLPRAVSNLCHFSPQTKVVSDISDLNTGDEKQLEAIPVEQAMPLDFSLAQFLHFTNTASVSSPTFGDRSGSGFKEFCFVLFFLPSRI